jgi:MFS family permease
MHATVKITSLATFLAMAVYTAPLSTAPEISADLRAGPVGSSWVLSSMSLGLAVFVVSAGAVADEVGRRRVLLAGLGILLLAVGAAAAAPTAIVFIAARVVQGLAAAAIVAASLALVAHALPDPAARTRATGIWGAGFGAGVAAGPLLTAAAEKWSSWRAGYVVLAVLILVVIAAARARVGESAADHPRGIDWAGITALSVCLGCLIAGLTEGRQGWNRAPAWVLLGLSALFLLAFTARERRAANPMVDLALFWHPPYLRATVAALATGAGITAAMSYLPTIAQDGQRQSAITSALFFLAWAGASAVTAPAVRYIPARATGPARLAAALVVVAAGLLATAALSPHAPWWVLLPGTFLAGLATGPLNATLGREAVASVPAGRAGMGGGMNNSVRFLGASIGVTVTASLVGSGSSQHMTAGWNLSAVLCAGISLAGALIVIVSHLRTRHGEPVTVDHPKVTTATAR